MNLQLKQYLETMKTAMKEGNVDQYSQAFSQYHEELIQSIQNDYEQFRQTNDSQILEKRGIRQLTSEEKKYYQEFIDKAKSINPKQEITDMNKGMPETVITDVYRELTQSHPLLAKINFQFTSFSTKWIISDHTKQTAAWGEITAKITEEITSAFKEYDMKQFKLSAFFVLSKPMLELGPEWVDAYVRTVLYDSLANSLENSIVTGTGKNMPIGYDRDIHTGVSVTDGVYPRKKKVKIKSFRPKEYGKVLAVMAKTEKGNARKFDKVLLAVNMTDYLTKIMPATTASNIDGTYTQNIFPFPTETVISNELADGEALLMLPEEYFAGLGTSKEGKILYDDSVKFFEDQRAFMIKLYGNGRPYDNTVSVLLDISELEELYTVVKTLSETPTTDPAV
jgi:hypothetical protein|uniref:Major capsid protein n=1 Tax=Siphoviridae sp. ctQtc11 TaxID=2825497 RepID=A0A8S5P455_9CAUD|nr:MAG TPA: major capsid protein [Siphoviridae sp. ctQtc11]